MDDVSDIRALYDGDPTKEAARLDEHQLERELTWRYLDAYLPESGDILEVGAATGAYTLDLARRGYRVTAVDLSVRALAVSRARAAEAGLSGAIRYVVADARDLGALRGETYHAALVMGPLYHLVYEADRRLAVAQAVALLRPGAPLISAHIGRLGILGPLMRQVPGWVRTADCECVLRDGRDPDDWPRGGFRGYFARVEEIAPLHEAAGLNTLALAAVEPAIGPYDEAYNVLSDDERRAWLDLLFRVSTEPSLLGASAHLLYVGRVPG